MINNFFVVSLFDDLNICSSNNKHHIKKHKTTSTTKPKMMKYLLIQSFSNLALPLFVDLHNNNNSFLRLKLKSQLKTSTFEKVWKNKSPIISPTSFKVTICELSTDKPELEML